MVFISSTATGTFAQLLFHNQNSHFLQTCFRKCFTATTATLSYSITTTLIFIRSPLLEKLYSVLPNLSELQNQPSSS